jgi:D-alanyl-lipoteichoic acid acyltransferase DltB (MBOAT superfamily)
MQNFAFPYFSRDIAEFWRRWHISLSTWFRDYLYIPLGGSRCNTLKKVRNIFIIFIISGFWHGANWTFIVWGTLNAVYFLPLLLTNKNRQHLEPIAKRKIFPSINELFNISTTFIFTVFAWIFFRAENIEHALAYLSKIFSKSIFAIPRFNGMTDAFITIILIILFTIIEWLGREKQYAIAHLELKWKKSHRWLFYYGLTMIIFLFGAQKNEFIYFQF